MMTARELIDYVAAEPFRPFRINMASGRAYEIRHRENIAVTKTSAKIFAPVDESAHEDLWDDVSLLVMESVEPIEATAAKSNP